MAKTKKPTTKKPLPGRGQRTKKAGGKKKK